jgi:predicted phage terminase large subunit-like protein|tara:strand:+ start:15750 stop:17435 length:1686 start_codon:yes stop_codon:yes gene_type:complete
MSESAIDLSAVQREPDRFAMQANRQWCKRRLGNFCEYMWGTLEPGRRMARGWALEAVWEHLEYVTDGHIKKLLINVPPGTMKSLTCNVLWPAWEWGPKGMPEKRYVCASYAERLSLRDNRKCRMVIQSDAYQQLWANDYQLMYDQNAKQKFENTSTGFKLATSVGGVGTGERGDRLIIDDPHNVLEGESDAKREEALQWFSETMSTRVNDPDTAAYIVIMQRVHERDVSGLILAEELGYEHLMLPMESEPLRRCWVQRPSRYMQEETGKPARKAKVVYNITEKVWQTPAEFKKAEKLDGGDGSEGHIDHIDMSTLKHETRYLGDPRTKANEPLMPDRFSTEYLEEDLKPTLSSWGGSYAVAGQLQQRPAPRGGGMFQKQWFKYVEALPADIKGRGCWGWDLAGTKKKTSAWTVGVLMLRTAQGVYYVVDVVRFKGTPLEVEDGIYNASDGGPKRCKVSIPQDPGQAGVAQIKTLAVKLAGFDVSFTPESGDKEMRARGFAAQAEAGNVVLIKGPWNKPYLDELTVFPASEFADQVDGSSRAFSELVPTRKLRIPVAPQVRQ